MGHTQKGIYRMSETLEMMRRINKLFSQLQNVPGRLDKEYLIRQLKKECPYIEDDLTFCFEVLAGMHKIGFTLNIQDTCPACHQKLGDDGMCYNNQCKRYDPLGQYFLPQISIKEFCQPLLNMLNLQEDYIYSVEQQFRGYGWFLNPLFNREWKLGIGPSQLKKQDISPMLAKKFDPSKFPADEEYYLTEKIDGNRCIARYNESIEKWEFFTRSGKPMKVDFDMADMPKEYIWDGEVVSESQYSDPSQGNFNATSGIINSKYGSKSGLIYLIFDFIYKISYKERRRFIGGICREKSNNLISKNVRILPILKICTKDTLVDDVSHYLEEITSRGGEGVMINLGSSLYQNKRTDSLLKVKKVYSMDMKVIDVLPGTGKYEGLVGSLECYARDPSTGIGYSCQVGSGLSDFQREEWAFDPSQIVGKIVEVAYFSVSQDKQVTGSKLFSLRFPRLKRVRTDKTETSID